MQPSSLTAAATAARRSTSIEWTEHTWNPFVGCFIASAGCKNCYAMRMAARLEAAGQGPYQGTTRSGVWTGKLNRATDAAMRKPLGLPGRAVIFVNSMSDFWHDNALDAWRAEALDIIERTPQHQYQILTKRPELIAPTLERMGIAQLPDNVWLGATVEDHRVTWRIDHLRAAPARIRFLSVEPLTAPLGAVDLGGIHWVITGGESGPGARPCKAEWVREARDQCTAADVPFFHKQWGKPAFNPLAAAYPRKARAGESLADYIKRIDPNGKGGALLDGKLWREMPDYAAA